MSAEFVEACARRDLDAIKRMVEERGLTRDQVAANNDFSRFVRSFRNPSDVAQWLVDRDSAAEDDEKSFLDILALQWMCENGNLQAAEWFVDRFGLTAEDIRSDNNEALCLACNTGHLEVAQWLVDRFHLTAEDARSNDNLALRCACRNGHLAVAQWLVDRFGLTVEDARCSDNGALRNVCQNGHLDVAQWLVDRFHLTAEDADCLDNYILRWARGEQQHQVLRWLLATFPAITIPDECAAFVQEVREQMAAEEEDDLMVKPAANTGE